MAGVLDELELELRRLPGIAGVGFSEQPDAIVVHILADALEAPEGHDDLRRQVVALAVLHCDRTPAIEIEESDRRAVAGDRPARVQLVDVRVQGFTQEVEVHLAHDGRRSVGRGVAGSPDHAAAATLDALTELGADLPFAVTTATAPVNDHKGQAVVVLLTGAPAGASRYGVAKAGTVEEAACRATLHALNRWLAGPLSFTG